MAAPAAAAAAAAPAVWRIDDPLVMAGLPPGAEGATYEQIAQVCATGAMSPPYAEGDPSPLGEPITKESLEKLVATATPGAIIMIPTTKGVAYARVTVTGALQLFSTQFHASAEDLCTMKHKDPGATVLRVEDNTRELEEKAHASGKLLSVACTLCPGLLVGLRLMMTYNPRATVGIEAVEAPDGVRFRYKIFEIDGVPVPGFNAAQKALLKEVRTTGEGFAFNNTTNNTFSHTEWKTVATSAINAPPGCFYTCVTFPKHALTPEIQIWEAPKSLEAPLGHFQIKLGALEYRIFRAFHRLREEPDDAGAGPGS